MGSSTKRQTTMAKLARERALQERRAEKQQKKDDRKQAKAEARRAESEGVPVEEAAEGEPAGD